MCEEFIDNIPEPKGELRGFGIREKVTVYLDQVLIEELKRDAMIREMCMSSMIAHCVWAYYDQPELSLEVEAREYS